MLFVWSIDNSEVTLNDCAAPGRANDPITARYRHLAAAACVDKRVAALSCLRQDASDVSALPVDDDVLPPRSYANSRHEV